MRTNDDLQFQLLSRMYDECQSQRRHHEASRANLSICLITAYTAIFGFADQGYLSKINACFMITVLSLIGFLSVMAYSERYVFYWRRSQCIRKELDKVYMGGKISRIYSKAKEYIPEDKEERKWPEYWPKCLNHHRIWMLMHILIFIFSACLLTSYITQ